MRAALAVGLAALAVAAGATAATPATSLTITHWPEGQPGPKHTTTLRCSPTGGTHPARAAACRKLAQTSNPFRPVPKDSVCTQIFGGPNIALVRGTYRGRRVWTYFRLRDGCEISRWKRVVPLLPSPGVA